MNHDREWRNFHCPNWRTFGPESRDPLANRIPWNFSLFQVACVCACGKVFALLRALASSHRLPTFLVAGVALSHLFLDRIWLLVSYLLSLSFIRVTTWLTRRHLRSGNELTLLFSCLQPKLPLTIPFIKLEHHAMCWNWFFIRILLIGDRRAHLFCMIIAIADYQRSFHRKTLSPYGSELHDKLFRFVIQYGWYDRDSWVQGVKGSVVKLQWQQTMKNSIHLVCLFSIHLHKLSLLLHSSNDSGSHDGRAAFIVNGIRENKKFDYGCDGWM